MFNYYAFGLELCSDLEIPGLPKSNLPKRTYPHIEISMGKFPAWLEECRDHELVKSREVCSQVHPNNLDQFILRIWKIVQDKYYFFRFGDNIEFLFDCNGTHIWVGWPDNLTLEDAATYLTGPILGFIFRLHDVTCLHASAVSINNQLIIFLGQAGAGKSTLAAAFAQLGHPVLSDDLVVLKNQNGQFLAQPSYPRVRLWEESVSQLYGATDFLPRIVPTHPTWNKRYLDLTKPGYCFQEYPLPIAAIYAISNRINHPSAPYINSLTQQESLITLLANTYTSYALNKQQRGREFEIISQLVKQIPIRMIIPHADLDQLPVLVNSTLKDLASLLVI